MQFNTHVKEAPCTFYKCIWNTPDEGGYIITINCLTCKFFCRVDNRDMTINNQTESQSST